MIELSEEQEKEIVEYICEEVRLAEAERAEQMETWKKWRRQREARPEHKVKTYPMGKRSSNVAVPLSAWNATTTFGHLIASFNVRNPFWTIMALRDDEHDRDIAAAITRYFKILSEGKHDLDLATKRRIILYEDGTLGFCPVKVSWKEQKWHFKYTDEDNQDVEVNAKLHDGPEIVPIQLEDFLFRQAYQDIQTAPWVAHIVHYPWHIIKNLGEQGIYMNVDDIEEHARTFPHEYQSDEEQRMGVEQQLSRIYDIHEVWMYYDADGDGQFEDIIVTVHTTSKTILDVKYNEIGYRSFEGFRHMIRPYYVNGIGTCWMSEHMQDEVDMWHNLRSDSAKISTLPLFVAKRNSGVQPNEQIYPGKIWFVDNPRDDIAPMRMPDSYPSSLEAENMAIMYSQKATAMPDAMGGFANQTLKTRDSIGLSQSRLQQSRGVFSSIVEGIQESFSNVGFLIFLHLARNKESVLNNERNAKRLTEEDQMLLGEALDIPFEQIPVRMSFSVKTTDIEKSFESKRQNYVTLSQLYSQFLKETTPVAMQLFGPNGQQMKQAAPQMYEYFSKVYEGASKLMSKIMQFFGEDDVQDYIPFDEREQAMREMMSALQGGMNAGTEQLPGPPGGPTGENRQIPQGAGRGNQGVGAAPQLPGNTGGMEQFTGPLRGPAPNGR